MILGFVPPFCDLHIPWIYVYPMKSPWFFHGQGLAQLHRGSLQFAKDVLSFSADSESDSEEAIAGAAWRSWCWFFHENKWWNVRDTGTTSQSLFPLSWVFNGFWMLFNVCSEIWCFLVWLYVLICLLGCFFIKFSTPTLLMVGSCSLAFLTLIEPKPVSRF